MPNATYTIEYRDKSGDKHTIDKVTNIKDVIGPLEGEGATGFVVLKDLPGGGTAAPTTPSNIAAAKAMNGSTSQASSDTPPDDSNDAAGAGRPSAPSPSPVEDNTPAAKKSGKVPAGLAAYIAAKAKGKK